MSKEIEECNSIEEVITEIDKIDKEIVSLLGKRLKYVEMASIYKKTEASFKAPERVKSMIAQRKKWAFEQKLSMIFIENLFKQITEYFIERERNKWIVENEFNVEIKIIQTDKNDLKEVLELQILSYQSEAINCNDFEIPPLKVKIEDIESEFKNKIFFKAVLKDKIIGSVRGYTKEQICYIEKLIVHPDFQNLGIGKKLILKIEEYFDKCKGYELFTGSKSEKNLKLYQKLGYKIYKKDEVNCLYDIIYLKKEI